MKVEGSSIAVDATDLIHAWFQENASAIVNAWITGWSTPVLRSLWICFWKRIQSVFKYGGPQPDAYTLQGLIVPLVFCWSAQISSPQCSTQSWPCELPQCNILAYMQAFLFHRLLVYIAWNISHWFLFSWAARADVISHHYFRSNMENVKTPPKIGLESDMSKNMSGCGGRSHPHVLHCLWNLNGSHKFVVVHLPRLHLDFCLIISFFLNFFVNQSPPIANIVRSKFCI